jgi:hypothetical protein
MRIEHAVLSHRRSRLPLRSEQCNCITITPHRRCYLILRSEHAIVSQSSHRRSNLLLRREQGHTTVDRSSLRGLLRLFLLTKPIACSSTKQCNRVVITIRQRRSYTVLRSEKMLYDCS